MIDFSAISFPPVNFEFTRREEVLATLGAVSDFSFSWGLMDTYTAALQNQASMGFLSPGAS